MAKNETKDDFPAFLIVIIIVVFVIIFIVTLGQIDIGDKPKLPKEFRDTKEEARIKHERLKNLIEKRENLKRKLQRKFKWMYFGVRLSFIVIWIMYLILFYFLGFISDLEGVLNYSEAVILLFVVLNFLTFGSFTNVKSFVNLIKTRLENWIWGKHLDIQDKIVKEKEELVSLKLKMEEVDNSEGKNNKSEGKQN